MKKLYSKTRDLDKIVINESLKNEIKESIPSYFLDIEKVIYVYIKLCQILEYDFSYTSIYKFHEEKERNVNNLRFIDKKNNKVLCYEFVLIFLKIIKEICSVKAYIQPYDKKIYEYEHIYPYVYVGEYFLKVDAFKPFFRGDIMNAKLGLPIKYIESLNPDEEIMKRFEHHLLVVYDYIKKTSHLEEEKDFSHHFKNINKDSFISVLNETLTCLLSGEKNATRMASLIRLKYLLELDDIDIKFMYQKSSQDIEKIMVVTYTKESEKLIILYRVNKDIIYLTLDEYEKMLATKELESIDKYDIDTFRVNKCLIKRK